MNILSLFDGISTGQYVLARLGVKIDRYYSSEIHEPSIKITQHNFPNTIQLGDVTNWQSWDIDWKSIDMILAGFPCQSFSRLKYEKGFKDSRGQLFFIFRDILNFIKQFNPDVKFLAENVPMKTEYSNYISQELGVGYLELDSADFSPQTRKRYYWFNFDFIPPKKLNKSVLDSVINPLDDFDWYNVPYEFYGEDKVVCAKLELKGHDFIKRVNSRYHKCQTLTGITGGHQHRKIYINGRIRKLTVVEYERLMGFHTGYTDIPNLSKTIKYNILGNGWEVYTIMHILKQFSPLYANYLQVI